MKRLCFGLLMSLVANSLLATSARYERAKKRLYEQESLLEQQRQTTEVQRKQKLLRQAQRRIDTKERSNAIEAYKTLLSQQEKPQEMPGQYAHVFPLPVTWPRALHYSYNQQEAGVAYSYTRADKAFDNNVSLVDVSALFISDQPTFKDILLASRVVDEFGGVINKTGNEYLQDLAQTQVNFSMRDEVRQADITLSYAMRNNSLIFGLQLPVVEKTRTLSYRPEVSDAVRARLRDTTPVKPIGYVNSDFRNNYGTSVKAFFEDVLEQKGMLYEHTMCEPGIGDINLFVTGSLFSRLCQRLQCSVQLTIPTRKQEPSRFFLAPQIGNGGSVRGTIMMGALFKKRGAFYPHAMLALSAGLPSERICRTPKMFTALSSGSDPAFGKLVTKKTFTAPLPDAVYPSFSQYTTTLVQRPGITAQARVGLLFSPAFLKNVSCDFSYEGKLTTPGTTYTQEEQTKWDVSWWEQQSYRVSHQIRAHAVYQYSDALQCQGGVFGTFLGKNTPLTYGYTLSLTGRW